MGVGNGTGFLNGIRSPKVTETKAASFVVSEADSGKLYFINAADLVATLPAMTQALAGTTYSFVIKTAALSAGVGFQISPAAADFIVDTALTAVVDKDLINSGASDDDGDMVTIVGDGVNGWFVTDRRGTWAKQA